MGEKVAFYFALSGFYNQMLIPPALVGLIIFIYGAASVFTDQPTYVSEILSLKPSAHLNSGPISADLSEKRRICVPDVIRRASFGN
jgi:hypothetical protein